jgi:hypothetical protein
MKTSILEILAKMYPTFSSDLAASPGLAQKIVSLLNDQQSSVRQAALDALLHMKEVFGPSLLVRLKKYLYMLLHG